MKTLRILALFTGVISMCLCLICLLSCSSQKDASDTTYVTDEFTQLLIVPDKKDLPSYDDLCKIEIGMTPEEVTQIVGYPQRVKVIPMPPSPYYSSVGDRPCCIYDSSDGMGLIVCYGPKKAENGELVSVVAATRPNYMGE